jgi:hypothetical protein
MKTAEQHKYQILLQRGTESDRLSARQHRLTENSMYQLVSVDHVTRPWSGFELIFATLTVQGNVIEKSNAQGKYSSHVREIF